MRPAGFAITSILFVFVRQSCAGRAERVAMRVVID